MPTSFAPRYVTVLKFCEMTGYTEDAVKSRCHNGMWGERQVWIKAPDGHMLIDICGYEKWAESAENTEYTKPAAEPVLIADLLDAWLARQNNVLAASTLEGYRKIVNGALKPAFGHHELSSFRRSHARDWAATQTFGNKRMTNVLSVLRTALDEATEDELVPRNVLKNWNYQRNDGLKSDDDIDPFTSNEQCVILGAMSGQDRNLFQFAFWTGLRTSEMVALRWTDIDWARGIVQVRRGQTRAARALNKVEKTKTRASRRDVKLLSPALAALADQKQFTLLMGAEVFHNPRTGAPWSGDQVIWLAWNRAIEKSRVRYRRPYQTRHTYASMMLSAGEPPMWVANQMGHISLKMIEQRYGRWITDAAPNAGRRAEALFIG